MPAGLQLFSANGTMKLDTTYGIPRYLGIANPGSNQSSGRLYVPEWETQKPWFVSQNNSTLTPLQGSPGAIKADGAYLTWSFTPRSFNTPIIYGCR